jgi:hypothetical protein
MPDPHALENPETLVGKKLALISTANRAHVRRFLIWKKSQGIKPATLVATSTRSGTRTSSRAGSRSRT